MKATLSRTLVAAASAVSLWTAMAPASAGSRADVQLHSFVGDSCIIADEPYFVPADPSNPGNAKFLPLLGVVIGQLASLFVHHEINAAAARLRERAAAKDTRYAMVRQMNLYRADLLPAPRLSIIARLGCLTIVAAELEPANVDCKSAYIPKTVAPELLQRPPAEWRSSRKDDSVENQLRRANICVKGQARAVYEARFEFSDDGTAYRLRDAGYRIGSLLTTDDRRAVRTALYTLEISDPGRTDREVLTRSFIRLGTVSAGARSSGSQANTSPWLRVPTLGEDARRVYEDRTRVHQEVMGQIEALKRAMTRNERILAGLETRIAAASGDVLTGLQQERTRIQVQLQTQSAELDARNAEYKDLPHEPIELMPVTIEVAVTETESAKKAELFIADFIGDHADIVTNAVSDATTNALSRAVPIQDVITDSGPSDAPTGLAASRARYYDALTEVQTAPGTPSADAQQRLAGAKDAYNAARHKLGLDPIP